MNFNPDCFYGLHFIHLYCLFFPFFFTPILLQCVLLAFIFYHLLSCPVNVKRVELQMYIRYIRINYYYYYYANNEHVIS